MGVRNRQALVKAHNRLFVLHRLAHVSNFFMALEKSSAGILFSWSVTVF